MIKSIFKLLFKAVAGVFFVISEIFDFLAKKFEKIATLEKIFDGIASVFAMFAAILIIIEENSFNMRKILNKILDWIIPFDFDDDDTTPNNGKSDNKKNYDLPQIKENLVYKISDKN